MASLLHVRNLMEDQKPAYIALEDAAKELGVIRSTLYYYTKHLEIKPKKFPLDKRKYITLTDLERIRDAKQAATEKRH